jgi:hypothetical protein
MFDPETNSHQKNQLKIKENASSKMFHISIPHPKMQLIKEVLKSMQF